VSADWFSKRDEIKTLLAAHLQTQSTAYWLNILEPADIWCARVMDYDTMTKEPGYQSLEMELNVKTSNGLSIKTTRCPIRIDGERFTSDKGAPLLGEHNGQIEKQFGLVS
jgi:crotonobetainyl-CoA:carnitine CoA-transferase CaiB-like acyl-CoA transferase